MVCPILQPIQGLKSILKADRCAAELVIEELLFLNSGFVDYIAFNIGYPETLVLLNFEVWEWNVRDRKSATYNRPPAMVEKCIHTPAGKDNLTLDYAFVHRTLNMKSPKNRHIRGASVLQPSAFDDYTIAKPAVRDSKLKQVARI